MAKERTKQCTCCGEIKTYSNFYKSQSPMYKHDQKLPICKQCVEDIYNENLLHYKDEEKALYKTLFSLDIYFDLKLCKRALIDTYNTDKSILKSYFSNINLTQYKGKTAKNSPPFNIFDIPEEDFEKYELDAMTIDMLKKLEKKISHSA